MGVKRALEMVVDWSRRRGPGVVTWGPLIHNPQVVSLLQSHGIRSGREIDELGPGKTVFISAHGISPAERERLVRTGARVCDASCPDVLKVQGIIKKYAARGYATVIFGDPGHTEVKGLQGYAGEKGYVVENLGDVDRLPPLEKVLLVSQTTKSQEDYDRLSAAVREKFPEVEVAQTICASTRGRQGELGRLLERVGALVVVGGKNSANTARLTAIARNRGLPVFQVETATDLPLTELEGYRTVGVTAGASTPNWLIQGVVDRLKEWSRDRRALPVRWFFRGLRLLVKGNVLVAAGALFLTLAVMLGMGLAPAPVPLAFSFLMIQAVYTVNLFADQRALMVNAPYRYQFFRRNRRPLGLLAAAEVAVAVGLGLASGPGPAVLALLVVLTGVLYLFPVLPRKRGFRRLKDSPQFREVASSSGWAAITVGFPLTLAAAPVPFPSAVVGLLFVLGISLVRSILFGVRDIQGDRLLGRGTVPLLLGRNRTKVLVVSLLLTIGALIGFGLAEGWLRPPAFSMLAAIAYACLYLYLYHRRIVYEGLFQEVFVDTQFILAGALSLLIRWLSWA